MADSQVLKALLSDNPLCGISTYKDTLNLATGACTRQIYKLVLHGTESYGKNVSGTYQYYMAVNPLHKKIPICVCSHLPSVDDYPADVIGVHTTRWADNAVYLNFGEDVMLAQPSGNTVDGLKEYITAQYNAGTPVTIWYIMKTDTTEIIPVPTSLTGTEEGYLTQSGTPSPSAPIYPTANTVNVWLHSLRKLTTATEAVENPLYSDGTAITAYTIKGNTVQNGTPTPSNPVDVNGVGVRTENLWGDVSLTNVYIDGEGNSGTAANGDIFELKGLTVSPETLYTFSWSDVVLGSENNIPYIRICFYTSNGGSFISRLLVRPENYPDKYITFTIPINCTYVDIRIDSETSTRGQHFVNLMFNTGSTAKPFEPYGYKIPISSGGVTTNIYLSEQLMKIGNTVDSLVSTGTVTYNIKKLVLTGNEEYSNDWRPATGTYAALIKISNTIPESDNVIPICTHLQGKHYDYLFSGEVGVSRVPSSVYCIAIRVPDTIAANQSELVSWLAAQYTNGTPVIVYYVIATAETETVTAPSIPTTEGANSITVDTTVQPSEFTATWTGWHDAEVKEKSANLFNTFDIVGQVPSISNGQLINYNGSTTSLIPIISGNITVTKPPTALLYLLLYAADMSYIGYVQNSTDANFYGSSVTGYENAKYCRLRIDRTTGLDDIQIMLNTGSTALPYEPYWK